MVILAESKAIAVSPSRSQPDSRATLNGQDAAWCSSRPCTQRLPHAAPYGAWCRPRRYAAVIDDATPRLLKLCLQISDVSLLLLKESLRWAYVSPRFKNGVSKAGAMKNPLPRGALRRRGRKQLYARPFPRQAVKTIYTGLQHLLSLKQLDYINKRAALSSTFFNFRQNLFRRTLEIQIRFQTDLTPGPMVVATTQDLNR